MALTTICSKCQREVPSANFELHEMRCPGLANARDYSEPGSPGIPSPHILATPPSCQSIAQALTWARTQPAEVVELLRERLTYYKGHDYYPPERSGRCVVTKEGPAVVHEAIEYLDALEPMGGVGHDSHSELALAAEDHVADIGLSGAASHSSSDGTTSAERVRRYGTFASFGECLWYGSELAHARCIILDLIVDDGVPSRGHRHGVFNPIYEAVGVAVGPHRTFGRMVALEFAKDWLGNPMLIRSRLQSGPIKMDPKVIAKAAEKASTQWKLGACVMCHEPIKGGRVVEIPQLGGKLHADCFKCSGCATSLAGVAYKVHNKAPYCNTCFYEQFGEKCTACSKTITDGTVKCALGSFHVACVVCATCSKVIGKDKFSTSGGVISCQGCTAEAAKAPPRRLGNPGGRASPGSGVRNATLTSAGSAIAAPKAKAKAGVGSAVAPKSKAKPKVSMMQAKSTALGMAMNYGDLA